ncbi:hypothetical protein ANCCAN_20639 [Ancylostoma caninum]|uniref:Nuclease HARBI1 n=1 Tax=Ancylostoma caninum TaxID=29170 RepID=A0A368FRS2_ANCCA|nr:hypothetical protein ANCCAN_20639 [Ancylostoma caninum]
MDEVDDWIRESIFRVYVGRIVRDRSSLLDVLDDEAFRVRFRLTRTSFNHVCAIIHGSLTFEDGRGKTCSTALALALSLQIMSSDTRQRVEGDVLNVSQPTASRILTAVLDAAMASRDKFITWPNREDEEQIKLRFYQLTGIPGVIGCVDGSHVEIRAPLETEYAYVNRKGWHSINVGYDVPKSSKLILFAVAMRNVANIHHDPIFDQEVPNQREQPEEEEDSEAEAAEQHSSAISFRNHIIANYFSR